MQPNTTTLPWLRRVLLGLGLSLALTAPHAAELPPSTALLPAGTTPWQVRETAGAPVLQQVEVAGQPFTKAWRIATEASTTGKAGRGLSVPLQATLRKGDVLWVSFMARSLATSRETGESFMEFKLERLVGGKAQWPPHIERGVSIGTAWTPTSFPFVMGADAQSADMRLVVNLDHYAQRFEIGPLTLLNFGPGVKLDTLPRSVVRYEGDAPDAPWRKAAAERIEALRKADLVVKVTDANGKPVPDAEIAVRMKRHAFKWGTTVNSKHILDEQSADARQWRELLARHFNQVVYENELKLKHWDKPEHDKGATVKKANAWLRQQGLDIRAHVLVWPSWRQSPSLAPFKTDPEGLRRKILTGITEQTAALRGEFDEWDVINEPYANHDVMDLLGPQEMVSWFKAARAGAPGVKLYLNDFTLFQGSGPGSPSQHFYDTAKFLKDNGAPIDAIGEQAHIGGTPPPIATVLERLDYIGQLGLPILITEFDINSNDDAFKARYLGDFITAVFSHPSTTGVVQWGFWAGSHWFPVAALWDQDWKLRPHGQVYIDLVGKTWWTNADLRSAADGSSRVRGFLGDYEVTVRHGGKSVVRTYRLERGSAPIAVQL